VIANVYIFKQSFFNLNEWWYVLVCCRQIESRRVAVSGFLMLLNNFNTLAGNFMSSQSASQSSCVGSSQVHNKLI